MLCAAGELGDGKRCETVGVRGDVAGDGYTVDVSRWASIALGRDGGDGSARLCSALAATPRAFAVGPGMRARAQIAIELIFPNNDVTLVSARIDARGSGTGHVFADGAGNEVASRAVMTLVSTLRAFGGTASAASVTTHVSCTLEGGAPPMAVPRAI